MAARGERPTIRNVNLATSRDSTLSFAVVWDPDKGIEAYSGSELLSLSPIKESRSEKELPELCSLSDYPFEESSATISDKEPFALFSSGRTHFIDIRSSSAYERCIGGHDLDQTSLESPLQTSSAESSFSDNSSCYSSMTSETAKDLPPLPLNSGNRTPNSTFTFAALWDPDHGLSAYKNGTLVKPSGNHFKSTSVSTTNSSQSKSGPKNLNLRDDRYTVHDVHEFNPRLHFPRSSQSRIRSHAIQSSTLEGLRGPWNYSCFDPLSQGLPFEARRAFSQYEGELGPHPIYSRLSTTTKDDSADTKSIDDEGFFETSAHPDCDPHLPSRFSTTTTSTSTYIAIDGKTTPWFTPPTLRKAASELNRNRSLSQTQTKNRPGLGHAKSFPEKPNLRQRKPSQESSSVPRLSNVFKGRWSKRPQDDRWVLVEVQSVITDRILEE
ncbi:hypothetical protein B0H34DRAFT_252721 [Crassisporium funariophilum]|nr:hypothetical protein B0H34DRAFT_252721 [Crassisporium funariophilum]